MHFLFRRVWVHRWVHVASLASSFRKQGKNTGRVQHIFEITVEFLHKTHYLGDVGTGLCNLCFCNISLQKNVFRFYFHLKREPIFKCLSCSNSLGGLNVCLRLIPTMMPILQLRKLRLREIL